MTLEQLLNTPHERLISITREDSLGTYRIVEEGKPDMYLHTDEELDNWAISLRGKGFKHVFFSPLGIGFLYKDAQ